MNSWYDKCENRNGGSNMYQNYIFDLYGTLVDINTDEEQEQLWYSMALFYSMQGAKYTSTELKLKYQQFCENERKKVVDTTGVANPDIMIEDVFLSLYKYKGITVSKELAMMTGQMFRVISTKYIKLYPGVIDLLQTLHEQKKKVYLLSNAQYIFTRYEMEALGLIPYFDGIVISSQELCSKPEEKFYQTVLSRYHLEKKDSIMIGNDLITDIKGAHDIGLKSLYIKSNISPEHNIDNYADYSIEDGDVTKIKELILQ